MAALCDFFSELGPKGLLSPVSLELKVGGEGNWRQDKNDDEFNDDAGENANPTALLPSLWNEGN